MPVKTNEIQILLKLHNSGEDEPSLVQEYRAKQSYFWVNSLLLDTGNRGIHYEFKQKLVFAFI